MAARLVCFVLAFGLMRDADAVISGPKFPRNDGVIRPVEMKLEAGAELAEVAQEAVRGQTSRSGTYHLAILARKGRV